MHTMYRYYRFRVNINSVLDNPNLQLPEFSETANFSVPCAVWFLSNSLGYDLIRAFSQSQVAGNYVCYDDNVPLGFNKLVGFGFRGAALNHGGSGHIMFSINSAVCARSWTSESPVKEYF